MKIINKIFIIDDDEIFIFLSSNAIKQEFPDAQLLIAHNGNEALKLLKEFNPDIIFLDLNMPIMGGVEFVEELEKINFPQIPIFVTTSSIDPSDRKIAEKYSRISGLIEKPITNVKLKLALN